MVETGFLTEDRLVGKCHSCKYYIPVIKKPWYRTGIDTKFCRGSCYRNFYKDGSPMYKQRNETCKKFEPTED